MSWNILEDVRYALRLLRKAPGFTAVAVVTLALGIGANTAIFTLLDQALLRSLPVKAPNRLVLLRAPGRFGGFSRTRTDDSLYFSYPMYRDLRDHNQVFSGLIATTWTQVGVQWHGQPELADLELVSGNYFDVLGVKSALGRMFVPSDDVAQEASPVIVLSFEYWQRRFGADLGVLNQSISINGHPFTVIGISEPGFHSVVGGDSPEIFAPMMMKPEITPTWNDLEERKSKWLNIVGRLKPEFNRQQAEASLDPLWHSLRAEELKLRGHSSASFVDEFVTHSHLFLDDGSKGLPVHGRFPTTLLIVMGMAVLMILMACTNVASLLLVRVASRTREVSVRYALGADRWRIVRQLFVEGLLLSLAGGIGGMILAPQVSQILMHTLWARPGSGAGVTFSAVPDLRVLTFNFVVAVLVSIGFSLAPAIQFWRPNVTLALKQQAMTTSGNAPWLRRASVVAQIGLSLLLLVGAGLFVRTLHNLKSVDVGFTTDHLITFNVEPRLAGYGPAQTASLYREMLDRLAALPGVRSAAATSDPELANTNSTSNITVAGYRPSENEDMNVEWEWITPGYFANLRMQVLAGREFTDQDHVGTEKVAVVNESFASHFFGSPKNAVDRYFCSGAGDVTPDIRIVGVVKDARHTTVRSDIARGVFTPFWQQTSSGPGLTFYVRTWQEPSSAEATIRQAMQRLDSNLVLDNLQTMTSEIDDNLTDERVIAFLASSFGVLAALMAAIGTYGVLAYSTTQRTREIGIRVAMGATRGAIVRRVLADVSWMAGIGIMIGVVVSLLLARTIHSQLFGVSGADLLTLCAVSFIVAVVALASAALPAKRAAKVDPMVALRYE